MLNVKEKIDEIREKNEGIYEGGLDWDRGRLEDIISDVADDYVDICWDDLINWAKEHIEEVDSTFNAGNFKNLEYLIQSAEFYYYMDILSNNIADFVKISILAHLNKENITDEKMEKIEKIAEAANDNDRLELLIEEAAEEEEEEEEEEG